MAAEQLVRAGYSVHIFDAMPTAARKFLLAGKGGLNLTHSEPFADFVSRYGVRQREIEPLLRQFDADALRAWALELGVPTFVGTSGRVFPQEMKAAPLLRAWLHRLRGQGVVFHMRQRFLGWTEAGALRFVSATGEQQVMAHVAVLALGGASWPQLGSDAAWVPLLAQKNIAIAPLQASNCGFDIAPSWTPFFVERFSGQPFKSVALTFTDSAGHVFARRGEFVVTATGIEGSLIYAVSSMLRDEIQAQGQATFHLDLLPDYSLERVQREVLHPRGARSLTSHLKSRLGIEGIKSAVLYECLGKEAMRDPQVLAHAIKALPMTLCATRPVQEAISTAGGVDFAALNQGLMLRTMPGVFCAGEMLDWEAPTGGYLLNACFAMGHVAGRAAVDWLLLSK